MCLPVIGGVLSMVAGIAQASAQQSAANADYAAKTAAWQQNIVNSEAAARDQQRQIITRNLQEQDKTDQQMHISYVQEAQKSATAQVDAAAGGVSGISVDNIIGDIMSKSEQNRTADAINYKYAVQTAQEDLLATNTKLISNINSVPRPIPPADTSGILALGAVAKGIGSIGGSSGASFAM